MIQTIKNHPPQALSTLLLIIPFFGKFNNYFHLFLKSCEYNPSINWLIITDDDTPYNYPSNVKVRYMSFAELRQKIQSNFDFPISLPHPYKLCDYKPAYGYIFAEELKGFDFWGHCDNDLIFGDIRAFLTPDIFLKYDKILCKGHLSIFRNNEQMNSFLWLIVIMLIKQYLKHHLMSLLMNGGLLVSLMFLIDYCLQNLFGNHLVLTILMLCCIIFYQ